MSTLLKLVECNLKMVSLNTCGVERHPGEMSSTIETDKDDDDRIIQNNDNFNEENSNRKLMRIVQSRDSQELQQDVGSKLEIKTDEHSNSYDALIKISGCAEEKHSRSFVVNQGT